EVVSDYSGLPGQSATPRTPTSRQRELMAPSALSGLPPKGAARINGDPYHGGQRPPGYAVLLVDLGDDARAHRAATLADGETQALVHRDRVDQRHRHLHVVAGHHHLDAFRKLHRARDVGRAEVELRAVALEERRVTATLVLRQHVHLGLELRVRRDRTRLAQHLAALHVVALRAAKQQARVVARLALVQQLAEHLDAGHRRLLGRADTDDLDLLAHLDDAALDAAGHHGAAARD